MMLCCGDPPICRLSRLGSHYIWSVLGPSFSGGTEYKDSARLGHVLLCRLRSFEDQKLQHFRISSEIGHGTHETLGTRSERLTGDASVELRDPAGGKLSRSPRMYMGRQVSGD
jgi:hypothetical protein